MDKSPLPLGSGSYQVDNKWTLFKIGGRFEFFLLWLLFSRSHAVEP